MNTRLLTLPLTLAAMLFALGCNAHVEMPVAADAVPDDKPKGEALPQAPMPRAQGEKAPTPTPWVAPKSTKPWSELIVGKWVYAGRDIEGQRMWEFTKDGKVNQRYSYTAAPKSGRPAGIERSSHGYSVNGNVLFPTSTFDDGLWVTTSTTFIERLTENELSIYAISRSHLSLVPAKSEAQTRKVPVEVVLGEIREERSKSSVYVRLKDKDK